MFERLSEEARQRLKRLTLELAGAQPDLGLPGETKRARLREVVEWLARDFRLVPLREAARSLDGAGASAVPAGSAHG